MRSAIAVAAFAAGAVAIPFFGKRDSPVAYYEDVVYETHVVTVTAYGPAPSSSVPAAPHYGHSVTYVAPAPSSAAPVAPVYSAPAASKAADSSEAAPTDYSGKVVYHHNVHRANHSAPDVTWSDDLYQCAKTIASSCVYAHNVDVNGGGYGQNIAAGVSEDNIGSVISDMFYNGEAPLYTYYGSEPDMGNFEGWGHFSQIVWKGTTEVACYTQYCPGGLANTGGGVSPYFTVCNYKGPGNYAGQYSDNVLAPLGEATISNENPGY